MFQEGLRISFYMGGLCPHHAGRKTPSTRCGSGARSAAKGLQGWDGANRVPPVVGVRVGSEPLGSGLQSGVAIRGSRQE